MKMSGVLPVCQGIVWNTWRTATPILQCFPRRGRRVPQRLRPCTASNAQTSSPLLAALLVPHPPRTHTTSAATRETGRVTTHCTGLYPIRAAGSAWPTRIVTPFLAHTKNTLVTGIERRRRKKERPKQVKQRSKHQIHHAPSVLAPSSRKVGR